MPLTIPRFLRPPQFENTEENQIAIILSKIFYALLTGYLVLFITRFAVQDMKEVLLLFIGLLLITSSFLLLQRKKLRASVLTLTLILLGQITLIAVTGQGIRDLAVAGYPSIIIVNSLLMNRRDYSIMVILAVICIFLVSVGPLLGVYQPLLPPGPYVGDFFVVMTITAMAALMSFLLARNMHNNLQIAHDELTERKKTGTYLKNSLQEKEILLKEIHHRVKNNLTVIKSLLSLQKSRITSKAQAIAAFADMENRLLSIAQVHEQLYKSDDFNKIAMKTYITAMTRNLKSIIAPSRDISFDLDVENIQLSIETAVPCGIIINELVTNALKHAFIGREKGEISITFNKSEVDTCSLVFADNGVGLPETVAMDDPDSLGLKLVTILTAQIKGTMKVTSDRGATFEIRFPLE